jgi:hypothetical protein
MRKTGGLTPAARLSVCNYGGNAHIQDAVLDDDIEGERFVQPLHGRHRPRVAAHHRDDRS